MIDRELSRHQIPERGVGRLCRADSAVATVRYRLSIPLAATTPIRGSVIIIEGSTPSFDPGSLVLELEDGRRMPVELDRRRGPRDRMIRITERMT